MYSAWMIAEPCEITSFFQSVLRWIVAVSTICRHSFRVVAFLQAVARPKFRGPRSASIARSQVWLGLPAGHFQSGGTCRIHAARARWWSSRGELRAIWPKSRRRLVTTWESGEQLVVLLTSAIELTHGECTVSSRSCVVPMCQMHRSERAGTLWWPKSHTHTSKLAQCISDGSVTWFPAWCLTLQHIHTGPS